MQQSVIGIFTRTPLHVGAGSSVGAIDQPIQRERHTGFPVIPGSSIKGVLRDRFRDLGKTVVDDLFGRGDNGDFTAGKIAFGEANLLAFPVRSAKGAFAMATSALAMQRYARAAGLSLAIPSAPSDMSCLAGDKVVLSCENKRGVVLEEYRFSITGVFPEEWENLLCSILDDAVLTGAKGRFVMLSDGDLSHFALNACQVQQHVRIGENGTADDGGLFNEETVPSETLFYAPVTSMAAPADNPVIEALVTEQLIQFGGNGTTGLGFCTVKLIS